MTRKIFRRAKGWMLIKTILVMVFMSSGCANNCQWTRVFYPGLAIPHIYCLTRERAKSRFSFASR